MKINNLIKIIDKYNIIIIKAEEAKLCEKRDIIEIRIINYHKILKPPKNNT